MGAERDRGDRWAALMVKQGGWVLKLPASVTAGIPDWLHARKPGGVCLVEAKTQHACAEAGTPWKACSGAQRFMLSMVARYAGGDSVRILVLGELGYRELSLQQARRPSWDMEFIRRQRSYV